MLSSSSNTTKHRVFPLDVETNSPWSAHETHSDEKGSPTAAISGGYARGGSRAPPPPKSPLHGARRAAGNASSSPNNDADSGASVAMNGFDRLLLLRQMNVASGGGYQTASSSAAASHESTRHPAVQAPVMPTEVSAAQNHKERKLMEAKRRQEVALMTQEDYTDKPEGKERLARQEEKAHMQEEELRMVRIVQAEKAQVRAQQLRSQREEEARIREMYLTKLRLEREEKEKIAQEREIARKLALEEKMKALKEAADAKAREEFAARQRQLAETELLEREQRTSEMEIALLAVEDVIANAMRQEYLAEQERKQQIAAEEAQWRQFEAIEAQKQLEATMKRRVAQAEQYEQDKQRRMEIHRLQKERAKLAEKKKVQQQQEESVSVVSESKVARGSSQKSLLDNIGIPLDKELKDPADNDISITPEKVENARSSTPVDTEEPKTSDGQPQCFVPIENSIHSEQDGAGECIVVGKELQSAEGLECDDDGELHDSDPSTTGIAADEPIEKQNEETSIAPDQAEVGKYPVLEQTAQDSGVHGGERHANEEESGLSKPPEGEIISEEVKAVGNVVGAQNERVVDRDDFEKHVDREAVHPKPEEPGNSQEETRADQADTDGVKRQEDIPALPQRQSLLPAISTSDARANGIHPFAQVLHVKDGSPAMEATLRAGDLLVNFGGITSRTPNCLLQIAQKVQSSVNQDLELVILRPESSSGHPATCGEEMHVQETFSLRPQKWKGKGLLGCQLNPFKWPEQELQQESSSADLEPEAASTDAEGDGSTRIFVFYNIAPDSFADQIGIKNGDLLVKCGELEMVSDLGAISDYFQTMRPLSSISLEVQRWVPEEQVYHQLSFTLPASSDPLGCSMTTFAEYYSSSSTTAESSLSACMNCYYTTLATSVHAAALNGHVTCLEALYEASLHESDSAEDPNPASNSVLDWRDDDGRSPLFYACYAQQVECVRFFLSHMAHDETFDPQTGGDSYGDSPLHAATSSGCSDIVALLLETRYIHIDVVNYAQLACVHLAPSLDVLDVLGERFGADLLVTDGDGRMPLSHACLRNDVASVEYLCEKHPDFVDYADASGNTPLHLSAWLGLVDVIRVLLKYLPSIALFLPNQDGANAFEVATASGSADAAQFLEECMASREQDA